MNRSQPQGSRRLLGVGLLALAWAAGVAARLFYLQVVRHGYYHSLAQGQHEHTVDLRAPRGAIFDRNGVPLAVSMTADSVVINPQQAPPEDVAAGILAPILELDAADLDRT
ncbi:MAG: penicillin-binding protein 2, partial [Firmicutes bacterium]|nr:penicillin-binding protein 2 [Bacillota bacterium]